MKENETLQRKLQSQEEDFRSQNQSLLEELSKVREQWKYTCDEFIPDELKLNWFIWNRNDDL